MKSSIENDAKYVDNDSANNAHSSNLSSFSMSSCSVENLKLEIGKNKNRISELLTVWFSIMLVFLSFYLAELFSDRLIYSVLFIIVGKMGATI